MFARRWLAPILFVAAVSCTDNGPTAPRVTGFLAGTSADGGIAMFVTGSSHVFEMLQTGSPATRVDLALGGSTLVTPTGFAVRDTRVLIPLGQTPSVAYADLTTPSITRFYTFPSGNTTGIAWVDDNTAIVANQGTNQVGRIRTDVTTLPITDVVAVTAFPTGVFVHNGRVFVVSSNLVNFTSVGPGVVTEINPTTMQVVRTFTVGADPQYADFGPDGKMYVTNSGDFGANNGTLSVINLTTNLVEATLPGFGDFPGPIVIDTQGRAFISSFSIGTIVWNTATQAFIRGPSNALCVTIKSTGACRGAADGAVTPNGKFYQSFYGATGLPGQLFIYDGATLALSDSITVPLGPSGLTIKSFR